MQKLSETQTAALNTIKAAGGVLNYQIDLYGFAQPGAARSDRIEMNTAKALIKRGLLVCTAEKTDGHGRTLIDQITLVGCDGKI